MSHTPGSTFHAIRGRVLAILKELDWVALLAGRFAVGLLFVSTGWGKVHSLDKVTAFFTDLGIPAPGLNAHVVSFVELVGGALLVIGLNALGDGLRDLLDPRLRGRL